MIFLFLCYHANYLQQIHLNKMLCKVYGLVVMLHVKTRVHIKNIDVIAKLEEEKNKVKNIALQNNRRSKY